MVDIVRVQRSTTGGNAPANLPEGQLAVNSEDRKIWIGTSDPAVPKLIFDNAAIDGPFTDYLDGYQSDGKSVSTAEDNLDNILHNSDFAIWQGNHSAGTPPTAATEFAFLSTRFSADDTTGYQIWIGVNTAGKMSRWSRGWKTGVGWHAWNAEPQDFIKLDGSTPFTGSWNAGIYQVTMAALDLTLSSGVPLTVNPGTQICTNLNADLLDNQEGSYYAPNANILHKNGSVALTGAWNAGIYRITTAAMTLNISAGAPLTVVSQSICPNLNADLLDGLHAADLAGANHTHTEYKAGYETKIFTAEQFIYTPFLSATHVIDTPSSSEVPAQSYAAFIQNANTYANIQWVLPRRYKAGTSFIVRFYWSHKVNQTEAWVTRWSMRCVAIASGTATGTNFGAGHYLVTSTMQWMGLQVVTAELAVAVVGSANPGNIVRIQIRRNAGNAGDTLPGDAKLHAIEIRYQTDIQNDGVI